MNRGSDLGDHVSAVQLCVICYRAEYQDDVWSTLAGGRGKDVAGGCG